MTDSIRKRILLVEDEALIAMSEKVQLEKYGYTVRTVPTGEKAVETVHASADIDLILMDINLGNGIDGTQAAETILNSHDIPIVFLSSHTEPDIVELTEKITSYGYVVKNSSITVLDASIKMAFRLFDAHNRLKQENDVRRRAETESKLNAALYRSLMANSIDAIYLLSETGDVLNVNTAACEMTGYSRDELISLTIDDIDPNYPSAGFIAFWANKPEGSTALFTSQHRRKDGTILDVEINGIFFVLDGRKLLFGVARDITERRRFEQELVYQKQYLETILETASDGFWVVTPDRKITNVNAAYCQMSGYSKAELAKMTINDLDALESSQETFARIKRIMEVGSETLETKHRRRDGSIFDVEVSATRHDRSDGVCLVCFYRDITERKQYTRRLKQIEWMLSEKKEVEKNALSEYGDLTELNEGGLILSSLGKDRLAEVSSGYLDLLETSSAVYERNGDYALGLFSSSWCQLMDRASRRLCGTNDNRKALSCGKWLCHDACWGASVRAIDSGKPADVKCPGGLSLYAVPIRANGETVGAINFGYGNPPEDQTALQELSDLYQIPVSDLQNASQTYQRRPRFIIDYAKGRIQASAVSIGTLVERKLAEKEIQKQLSEKEVLLREVHHRVSNNIGTIESLLSLQADATAEPEVRAALQLSISRVRSMRVLYEKLLAGNNVHEVSIRNYMESLIDSLLMAYDIEGKVTIERSIADFSVDPKVATTIGIIVNELLTNSFKYAFTDRDSGVVSVSIAKEDRSVTLTINDDGGGFDARALENKSPGLGLTLVRMLTEQLGGTYNISSDSGAMNVVRFGV